MKRSFTRLLLVVVSFLVVEALVFRTGWYSSWLEPDSTSGSVRLRLDNELARYIPGNKNQIIAVGDSRMGLFPRMANQFTAETGYTFASISLPGATMRSWYYMLREVDSNANRYAAVLIPVYDYDDDEMQEDFADRLDDLNYSISTLRLSDAWEFSRSWHSPDRRIAVLEGALFKGIVYKRDVRAFLLNTKKRIKDVELYRGGSANWLYGYAGEKQSLTGLRVDWSTRDVTYPPGIPDSLRELIRSDFTTSHDLPASPDLPRTGRQAAYRREWIGKIIDRYRGSATHVIFLRLPRGPVVNPAPRQGYNAASVTRGFASRTNVVLLPEHTFDELERPEFFQDPIHMNGAGCDLFSKALAREVPRILHPAQSASR